MILFLLAKKKTQKTDTAKSHEKQREGLFQAAINSWVTTEELLIYTPTLIRCGRLGENCRQTEDKQDSGDKNP